MSDREFKNPLTQNNRDELKRQNPSASTPCCGFVIMEDENEVLCVRTMKKMKILVGVMASLVSIS
jgi:hypothetical protein